MRMRPKSIALAATTIVCITLCVGPVGAQTVDSTRRWSLFGGSILVQGNAMYRPPSNLEVGGSGEFRVRSFPLPLRASLAFSSVDQGRTGSSLKYGTFSIDAIARPVRRIFGIQPYFVGGLGAATRAGFTGLGRRPSATDPFSLETYIFRESRSNWTFVEGGMGLDIGRAFVQFKTQVPVASNGDRRTPISVGFRF